MMERGVKERIGEMKCLGVDCEEIIPVWKDSKTGALSYSCPWCRAPGYAKNDGSPHYKKVMARAIQGLGIPPDPVNAPPRPPEPKPRGTIFG